MMKRGQALVIVFFLLTTIIIIGGALVIMAKAEISIGTSAKNSLIAFYTAQAGIERGKVILSLNWAASGSYSESLAGNQYIIIIPAGSPPTKRITSSCNYRGAQRKIAVTLRRSGLNIIQDSGTWQEE
ncbi:MAG: hypothetical protein ABIG46_03200 [Candidatus Omnitrophota bacterium]|nr:hypothetical protein [Candidatus Omnitrophota bacterium]